LKLGFADAEALYDLGNDLLQAGRLDEAIAQYQQALDINPGYAPVHSNLATALLREGRVDEAITQCQAALKIQPDNVTFQNNLARIIWALATSPNGAMRNGSKALGLAQQANELVDGNSPVILRVLAAAYAETGDFPKAIEAGQQAVALAVKAPNSGLVNALQQELALYQAKSPVRSNPADMSGWQ
jgi:tetratricopeptide (TPR) repeat protein